MEDKELVSKAYKAMKYAYAPYSNFKVGAALITDDGSVYTGCNIENSSYGACNCAERTAIYKAVSEGKRKIKKIAIVSSSHKQTPPCGICRQVMSEFMDEDGIIVMSDDEKISEYNIGQLLPYSFKL